MANEPPMVTSSPRRTTPPRPRPSRGPSGPSVSSVASSLELGMTISLRLRQDRSQARQFNAYSLTSVYIGPLGVRRLDFSFRLAIFVLPKSRARFSLNERCQRLPVSGASHPRERDVGVEFVVLGLAYPIQSSDHALRQSLHSVLVLVGDPGPDHPRALQVREHSDSPDRDLDAPEAPALDPRVYSPSPSLGHVSQELYREVDVLPAHGLRSAPVFLSSSSATRSLSVTLSATSKARKARILYPFAASSLPRFKLEPA